MTNLTDLTTAQLRRIVDIKEQIDSLQGQIDSIGGGEIPIPSPVAVRKKRRMSRAGRAASAAGQRARWAKLKNKGAAPLAPKTAKMKDRRSSPAVRAKLAAAARARWKKARAAGKKAL